MDLPIVLEQGGEIDVVAVTGTENANRLAGVARCSPQELVREVLAVIGVKQGVRERASIRQALLVHLVVEPGRHVG
jgi:hypothetical protein